VSEKCKKPNILLLMPDQMRGDCLGLEGHPSLLTPNMDEIGAKGAHFERAYTTSASSIPARRSLLTGQYPSTNRMVGFRGGCPITSPTLPEVLKDNGYNTVLAGRNMHQYPSSESYGYEERILGSTYVKGDQYFSEIEKEAPESDGVMGHGISLNGWTAKPWHLPEYLHPTNWVVRKSRSILEERDSEDPLFMTASFYAPHPPLIPPEFYMQRYLRLQLPPADIGDWAVPPENNGIGAGIDAHRTCLEGEALRSAQAGYFGLINHLDDQIYYLINDFKIKSMREGRPWVIVFTSDHGEMLGDHYYFRKCEPYEGSSRIPLLIQGSRDLGLKSNISTQSPVCLEDIMPTLLDLAAVTAPDGMDGKSLVPILKGEGDSVRTHLHTEHAPCYSQKQAYHMLTDGEFKYIWRPLDGEEQLFNINKDPGEEKDLSTVESFRGQLLSWRELLIQELSGRPEGFTDGEKLIPGKEYNPVLEK